MSNKTPITQSSDADAMPESRDSHQARWHRVPIVVFVIAVVLAAGAVLIERVRQEALLHLLLSGDSYEFSYDDGFKARLRAIAPRLIHRHRDAVKDSQGFSAAHLQNMDAFNERVATWHAILLAAETGESEEARRYIKESVRSPLALGEEVSSGTSVITDFQPESSD